ncbi:23S rRNA (adenine(2030)-N(6))-methyltransferase RlmJ [Hylemonella sp. W303a]|uniref:23S rRNA (adenine(2030)-N(6))-methyltransferase RlmJ n=1 Tax=Hylemonella sp. W303a TaxID=3389873 RepID=UPI00396B0449
MFSYRHAFHAGNHADVLKHSILIAIARYLTQKDTALTVIDTHAGAGLYRLDGDYAQTSGEAADGIAKLIEVHAHTLPEIVRDYVELVNEFNPGAAYSQSSTPKVYPGSPFVLQRLLRQQDRLKLFELHPTDSKALAANIAQLEAERQIAVLREDGFGCVTQFLPPPSRRALLLCDPSYEIKTDYARVASLLAEGLKRFATGCYAIWHPIIPRPEAHELPRRLRTLTNQAGRPWLHATLTVKSGKDATGLPASGMFIVNPPHTLQDALKSTLPQLVELLGQDRNAAYTLESTTH